jgi:hypothetical protein
MFESMVEATADFVAEYLLKKAEQWAMSKILDAMGLSEQKIMQSTMNLAAITGDAGVAAAGAMAYYSAIYPPIAPAMAAAQFAMTMAYAPMALDTGTNYVPHDGVAMIHRGEAVLPATTAGEFRDAMSGGSKPSSGPVLHYSPQVSGLDRNSFKSMLDAHSDHLLSIVRQGYREGSLA